MIPGKSKGCMHEDQPSEIEQATAEKYVMERPLERPDLDAKKAGLYVFGFIFFNAVIAIMIYLCCLRNIFSLIPVHIVQYVSVHKIKTIYILFESCSTLSFLFTLRKWIVMAVALYQHYAPEEIRRRCLFMPTCSEYMILAVTKYGAIIGLYKGWDRLFRRCRGNIYRIDYP